LDVPKNDVIHGAGQRDVAGQRDGGRRIGSGGPILGRFPARLDRRIGAQGGCRRQENQEGRHCP
jgi:hypothetical protein